MKPPTVSVVIPCYNQAQFLPEAVDSVLGQTFQDFEIVVVNDGSTEPESQRALKEFSAPKTIVLHQENQGRCRARNNGIRQSSGRHVLCLDADDKIGPFFLEKAVALLESSSDLGGVTCRAELFGAKTGEWKLADHTDMLSMLFDHCVPSTCVLFRREDWEKVGGFDPKLDKLCEDFDLWLSLLELGRGIHKIPEVMFYYRKHPQATTVQIGRMGESGKYELMHETNLYIFRKHHKLYLEHAGLYVERLFTRMASDRPRFASVKASKYRLLLRCYKALSALPPLRVFSEKRIRKLERKLGDASFYLEGRR